MNINKAISEITKKTRMSQTTFESELRTFLHPGCGRLMRLCSKIEELVLEDIEGDTEEFLNSIRNIFLVICAHLHTDVDNLECYSGGENPESYISIHHKIEEMYNKVQNRVKECNTNLVFEQKRDWFSEEPGEKIGDVHFSD